MPERKRLAGTRQPCRSCRKTGWATAVMLTLLISGCASSTPTRPQHSPEPVGASVGSRPTERMLRSEIQSWLGTPHRMGGMSRRGIDCSGLAVSLYRDLFGIHLPRTTRVQMRSGRWVERDGLLPGDLVFFKPVSKTHHVGIYLGSGEFVHASTRRGVMISRMDDDFWRGCYLTGRRLLPHGG